MHGKDLFTGALMSPSPAISLPDSVYTGPHHQPARQDSPELGGLPGEEVAGSVDQTEDQDYTLYTTTPHQSDITGNRN